LGCGGAATRRGEDEAAAAEHCGRGGGASDGEDKLGRARIPLQDIPRGNQGLEKSEEVGEQKRGKPQDSGHKGDRPSLFYSTTFL